MPNGAIIEFFKQGKCGIQCFSIEECIDVYESVKSAYPDRIHPDRDEGDWKRYFEDSYGDFVMSVDLHDPTDKLEHGDIGWHIDNGWVVLKYADLVGLQGPQLEIDEGDILSLLFL